MDEVIAFRLLQAGARPPVRATEYATGYDLHASLPSGPVTVGNAPVVIPTGVAIAAPAGLDVQVRPRSGLAKKGVLCTYGTIDADYRGELLVTLYTISPSIQYQIEDGDRIAQLVVSRLVHVRFEQFDELSETTRGTGGHGSTGR